MRKLLLLLSCLVMALDVNAVLKEKDLEQTLQILRSELTAAHRELSMQSDYQKKQGERMLKGLISTLQESNQNALMLYSQRQDYVFDLTYACHEATEQYRTFIKTQLPFVTYRQKTEGDIARYDSLISSLKMMPMMALSERAKTDRNVCLTLAVNIRNTLQHRCDGMSDYINIYEFTAKRLKEVNDFANKRYDDIQTSIFRNGGDDYFTILRQLGSQISQTSQTVSQKYKSNKRIPSQWDSRFIFGLFIIIFFYGVVASVLNILAFRFLMPKRLRTDQFMRKRPCIIMATSTMTFALILGIIKATSSQNFIIMASDLLVEYAWLLGAILVSLLLRLNGDHIKSAFKIYSPLIVMGFIVISFRIILIPNELVNLIFPPVLVACTFWQWRVIKRHHKNIPSSDITYSYITQAIFITSVICSWAGYTLMSVQILIWWIMQLTCILTIACIRRWLKLYGVKKHYDQRPITSTWAYLFVSHVFMPVMGVASVMISIYWAASVFNLNGLCWNIFSTNFVDLSNLKLSVIRLSIVTGMWFFFSYVCNTIMAFLRLYFERQDPDTASSRTMMGKNVIQVVVWGAWGLISLSILGISFTWLMVVTGGLSTGIGFASKDILENIYYGVSLMMGRIKVGDLIECDGIRGKVASISYTSTLIESSDGSVIAFQNSQLFTKNYKNLTRNHGYALSVIIFGVGYGSNIKEVCSLVEAAVNGMRHEGIDPAKPAKAVFVEFGDNSVNLKLLCWVDVLKQVYVESDIKECIYSTLNSNNIEIPFPQRDIYIKNWAEK